MKILFKVLLVLQRNKKYFKTQRQRREDKTQHCEALAERIFKIVMINLDELRLVIKIVEQS